MAQITSNESAKAWLATQTHQGKAWFALRCALRIVPRLGSEVGETRDKLASLTFRALLVSGAAATCPTKEMEILGKAAISAHNAIAESFSEPDFRADKRAAGSADIAAAAANTAGDAADAGSSAKAAAHGAARAISEDSDAFAYSSDSVAAFSADTDNLLAWAPLWYDAGMPESLAPGWRQLRAHMQSDHDTWGFWLEWYEAILEGCPLPWDLSFRIATTLTEEDWDKGPAHVAKRIAEIRQAFDVASAVSELRGSTVTVTTDALWTYRGHNNPPELIEDPALVESTVVVWAALDELEHEANAETPNKSRARQALGVIKDWFLSVCAYLGRKADLAIDTLVVWGVKEGIKLVSKYWYFYPLALQKVIDLAETWLK